MKKSVLSFLAALVAVSIAADALADEVSALRAVRSQPLVKEAALDGAGSLYVAVKADRAGWGHYAGQVCQLVRPHHARILQVRIVDITTVSPAQPPTAWKRLAETKCG